MKLLWRLLALFSAGTMVAMDTPDRVPSLKSLAGDVLKKQNAQPTNIPQELSDYLKAVYTSRTFGGDPQQALYDMVRQGQLTMSEQLSFLRQKYPHIDLNKKYSPQDKFGITLLGLAAQLGQADTVQILLANGARVNEQDLHGWTALEYATRFDRALVVQHLIAAGADLNIKDGIGRTALIQAVRHLHPQIAKMLIEAGANKLLTDDEGLAASDYAQRSGNKELIAMFSN